MRPHCPSCSYLHGGGFTIGSIDTHDSLCRQLALRSGVAVLSLNYRLAPEHRFPAAVDDCWAVMRWLAEHAISLGLDGSRLAVGGDSAGGTLAAVCALHARDIGLPLALQLLITPGTTAHADTASHKLFANGFLLDAASIAWFFDHYIEHGHRRDWRFAPLEAPDHSDLRAGLRLAGRMRPAGGRRHRLCRSVARQRRAGTAGAVSRRDPRFHQDGAYHPRGLDRPRCLRPGSAPSTAALNHSTTAPLRSAPSL